MSRWTRKTLRRIARAHGVSTAWLRNIRTGDVERVSLAQRIRGLLKVKRAKR